MNDYPLTSKFAPQDQNALKIAGLYLLTGGLWILFSDQLALMLTRDPVLLNRISLFKGWGYIVVTALLLYWLIRRYRTGLSQSEARYRSLFQNNHSVILLIDPASGAIVDANPSACAFYGYTHPEITGLEITAINQLSREQVFAEMERAMQEQRRHFFFRHCLSSGDIREVEVYSGPIEVQGKALLYSIVHDITERKLAEEQFRLVVETAPTAFLLVNKDHQITLMNGQAEALFGYSREELIGQSVELLIPPHVRGQHHHYREVFFAAPQTQMLGPERNIFGWHKEGRPVPLQVGLTPLTTVAGTLVLTTIIDLSERQQAEAALRESEEKYRTLLEALADGVFVAQDYHFVFANPALPAMLGYTPEAFVGLPFEAVIAPEFLPVWTERFTQRVNSGPEPLKHYEVRFLGNGGERSLWVELRASRIEYQGRPAVMGIIRDITERKQTQETLRENEERLRLALMAANQGLYDLNIQTGEAQVSSEYVTMLGYDPATFHETNAAWIERLHPDDRQPVADNYRAYVAGEVPVYAVEFRQRTQGGDWKWILSLGKIVAWDSAGQPLRMLGTHTDIHERKLAEQQLRYQASLLQNVSDAIIATDLDFKITSWNQAAEAIYGWSAAEVLGRSTTDLFQVEYNNFQPEQIDQYFQEEGFWQGEVTQKSKSGATIQIMASVSLIRDSQGRPMGVVAVNRDLTAYRQAEAQLQQATTELIFLNDLLKHSTQPISVANLQGQFVRFNRAYEQLTGYQEEELLQLTYEQLTPTQWHDMEAQQIAQLRATGQAVRFQKEYRCKDGTVTPVELVVELYRDAQGEPLYTYGFTTDISERKQAEEKLRLEKEKLDKIAASVPGIICSFHQSLTGQASMPYASPATKDVYGLDPWDIADDMTPIFSRILPEDVGHVSATIAQSAQTMDIWKDEFRYQHPTKGLVWIEGHSMPVREADGSLTWHGFIADVTERKQAEEKLRQSESRFRAIFEQAAVGVAQIEAKTGRFIQINQAYCDIVGYSQAEMLNNTFQNITHPDDLPDDLANMDLLLAGKIRLFTMEKRYIHQNGSIVWINLSVSAMWDIGAEPDYHIAIVENITERKQAEKVLEQTRNTLAQAQKIAHLGSFEYIAATQTTMWSEEEYRIYGLDPAGPSLAYDIMLQKFIHPDDAALLNEAFTKAMQSRSVYELEHRIVRPDGSVRWVYDRGQPYFDGQGELERYIGTTQDITERKQAEEALQTASRRFQTILSALYGGVLVVSNDHRIEFANPAFCHMFDLDEAPEALLGLSAAEMIQKITHVYADPPLAIAHIREILAAGQSLKGEEIAMAGGRTYLRDFIPIVIDGNEYGRLWHHLDITERQQAEAALRQSEENFSKAFKSSPAALLLTRLADGQFIELNDAYCAIVGYDRSELIGRRTTEFNIYIDSAQRQAIVDQLRASGSVRDFETSIRHRSGAIRHVVANQEIITLNGEVCILSNLLDITERKRAEEKLRASEAKFKAVFDNAPVGISLLDAERNLLESNDMLAQIVRLDEARLVAGAYRARKYIREDGTEIPVSELASTRAIVEHRAIRNVVNGIVLENGETIWTQVSAAPLGLDDPRFVVITQDITERKQAEAGLHRIMAELKRSNADLEQFAYAASHDLQEPLRGVTGMLTLLQQRYVGQLDERADEFIHHAVEGASRMQTLINDLLVFSRVGTRGQPFRPVDLVGVLADAQANLTVAIRESEAAISYDNLPTIVADRTQLTQLFQNLIGNAIKFRGDRAPEIRIKAERQAGEWVFAVADNGIGLEAKDFERIFGVFQRLHTRREYPGTGIGLALCKKIVERHGGRIWVESQPGQGATFYFTLPGEAGQSPVIPA